MLGDDSPERSRVRSPDGLPLIEYGRTAVKERGIDNVRMPHNPAYIRGGPEDIPRFNSVYVLHGPLQSYGVSAVIPHTPFGIPVVPEV